MTLDPTKAERQHLTRRVKDGTYRELAEAHNTMSAIRSRAAREAMGEDIPSEEPDPTDDGNPFVVLAESAKALQFALAALLDLRAQVIAEREARQRRDRVVFGVALFVFLFTILYRSLA